MHIFLYGPPGSGKSTLGNALAQSLDLPFYDLDIEIESRSGMTIAQIFAAEGESGFRSRELTLLRDVATRSSGVVALGGGALLNPAARSVAESSGQVLCLMADQGTLLGRINNGEDRPLISGDPAERLAKLLSERTAHYNSFPLQLDTSTHSLKDLTWIACLRLGTFRVRGMGRAYDVRIDPGGLDRLGEHLRTRRLNGPVALVSDRNVGALYLERAETSLRASGYETYSICIAPGEEHKTIETVLSVWDFLIKSGVERGSTVVALGGGITGDLTGFAASAFLRGVAWVNVPTSLLAMVDSSLGGKTGIDLPQAKNMVGAFYPPVLVLADPQLLSTLPVRELRNGLSETLKHGVIADPLLFDFCSHGLDAVAAQLDTVVRQGMAVKLKVIEEDPYEKGLRQALNLGHTIGHGVELASDFRLSHGEAVAIGMVAEARFAEQLGLCSTGLADQIMEALTGLGLPVEIPSVLSLERVTQAMQHDKKRAAGKIRFALPIRIGEVRTGVIIEGWQQMLAQAVISEKGA